MFFPACTATHPQTHSFPTRRSSDLELDEIFTVNLSNAPNATITKGTGTGTIQNDDAKPLLSDRNSRRLNSSHQTTTYAVTGSNKNATALPVSVDFATASGTAIGNTSCT